MRVTLDFELSDALARELQSACRECQMTVQHFAAESVEAVLAGRRLSGVRVAPLGARVKAE